MRLPYNQMRAKYACATPSRQTAAIDLNRLDVDPANKTAPAMPGPRVEGSGQIQRHESGRSSLICRFVKLMLSAQNPITEVAH
jgi:hypothetical protein